MGFLIQTNKYINAEQSTFHAVFWDGGGGGGGGGGEAGDAVVTQEKFIRGGSVTRSKPLHFYKLFLT